MTPISAAEATIAPPAICVFVKPVVPVAGAGVSRGGVGRPLELELEGRGAELLGAAEYTTMPSPASLEGASELEELGEGTGGGSGAAARGRAVAVDALEGTSVSFGGELGV